MHLDHRFKQPSYLRDLLIASHALVLVFFAVAFTRFVAADEGFYSTASKIVMQGKVPYLDFFYPQTPLLPYLYGSWMSLFGFTWFTGRALSALLAVLTGILLWDHLRGRVQPRLALFATGLFVFSGFVIGWYPIMKPYALSTFFLFLAYIRLANREQERQTWHYFFCGLCVGAVTSTRAYLVVVALAFLLEILIQEKERTARVKAVCVFILGGAVLFLPHLILIIADFNAYWFNNLGYHSLRSPVSPEEATDGKVRIAKLLLGLAQTKKHFGKQFALLLFMTLGYLVGCVQRKRWPDLSIPIIIAIVVVSFLPTPSWLQYFCVAVPFLVVPVALACDSVLSREGGPFQKEHKFVFSLLALIAFVYYVFCGFADIRSYTVTGKGVHGTNPEIPGRTRVETIRAISREVESLTKPGDLVHSRWPGFVFDTHANVLPGLENQFWIRVTDQLSSADHLRYHLMSKRELRRAVRLGTAPVLVTGRKRKHLGPVEPTEFGYELTNSFYGVEVYRLKSVKDEHLPK